MTSAALELQKAVFAALAADPALTDALGGARIYDVPPPNVAFPHITFGQTSVHDWSTASELGHEHLFTLHVWSKAAGKREALSLMALAAERLQDAALTLDGHALVSLRQEFSEVRLDEDLAVHHGLLRFRAVTEAL
ncbi:DUF3168 domain-containing protein [Aquibium sp. A9E412]|uniref:DUF3168 domain-containing protein n=1 Tax=Aquibium sp. A9E412 TaxID=2976767 RepID=UPI0025B12BBC|nr:DUF3168 domain-containing protein [Aquibium sp. A9E412]MDN2567991.1 DUF3168 domain-containing protein [Aquibium sp. A9E412]